MIHLLIQFKRGLATLPELAAKLSNPTTTLQKAAAVLPKLWPIEAFPKLQILGKQP
jgi:hypothetical protein